MIVKTVDLKRQLVAEVGESALETSTAIAVQIHMPWTKIAQCRIVRAIKAPNLGFPAMTRCPTFSQRRRLATRGRAYFHFGYILPG